MMKKKGQKRLFETLTSKKGLNFKGFHQCKEEKERQYVEHCRLKKEGFTYARVRDIKSSRRARFRLLPPLIIIIIIIKKKKKNDYLLYERAFYLHTKNGGGGGEKTSTSFCVPRRTSRSFRARSTATDDFFKR